VPLFGGVGMMGFLPVLFAGKAVIGVMMGFFSSRLLKKPVIGAMMGFLLLPLAEKARHRRYDGLFAPPTR